MAGALGLGSLRAPWRRDARSGTTDFLKQNYTEGAHKMMSMVPLKYLQSCTRWCFERILHRVRPWPLDAGIERPRPVLHLQGRGAGGRGGTKAGSETEPRLRRCRRSQRGVRGASPVRRQCMASRPKAQHATAHHIASHPSPSPTNTGPEASPASWPCGPGYCAGRPPGAAPPPPPGSSHPHAGWWR